MNCRVMRTRLRRISRCSLALSLACAVGLYLCSLVRPTAVQSFLLLRGGREPRSSIELPELDVASLNLSSNSLPEAQHWESRHSLSTWGHCRSTIGGSGGINIGAPDALVAVESRQADAAGRAALRAAWSRVANLTEATAQLVFFLHQHQRHQPMSQWSPTVLEFYIHGDMVMDSGDQQTMRPTIVAWRRQYCPSAGYLLHASLSARLRPRLLPDVIAELSAGDNTALPQLLGACSLLATATRSRGTTTTTSSAVDDSNSTSVQKAFVKNDPEPLCV